MHIERATIERAVEIHQYMKEIFEKNLNGLSVRPNGFALEDAKKYLPVSENCKNRLCAIAIIENKIVGQIAFSRYEKPEYTHGGKFGMSVNPNYWRQGIGTRLLADLESWANENGIEKLELEVWSNNTNAINLYRKHGYSFEGCRKQAIKSGGEIIDLILMGKILAYNSFSRTPQNLTG